MTDRLRGGLLPGFSLRRPVTVVMGMIALIVVGSIAWRDLPLELVPGGFTPPFLFVQIPTLRASPEDVEERIALPAEELLSTVRNVERLGTRIRTRSASFIMEFRDGTDMDVAYNQVRDRVERLLPSLGDDIGQYFIWKYNPADDPVLWFAITLPEGSDDPGAVIERRLVPRIERIAGVSRVEVNGLARRVVAVDVDDRLAEAAGTSLWDLVQRLSRDNFALAGGEVEDAGSVRPLRIVARWASIEAMRELPVGEGLVLGDVADVRIEDRAERALYRVNGRPCVYLQVYKESTANTVEVARLVRETMTAGLADDPALAGAEPSYFFDQGELIEGSLGNLQQTAVFGAFFAVVVLAFFLRHARMTLVVTIAIPASLLATLVVMYAMGRSLNVLSLTGLMLAVGLVVDNSIVVVENIQRVLQQGASPRQAALKGAAEVALAIVVATLTTVVVFLPLILMTGDDMLSFYLSQIGVPVCVALVSSLFVSLLFLPLITSRVLGHTAPPRFPIITWLENRYAATLALALRRRADVALIGFAVFASTYVPMKAVSSTDQSSPNMNDFSIYVSFPETWSWDERADLLLEYEGILLAHETELGLRDLLVRYGAEWGRGMLRGFLVDPDDRPLDRDAVVERAQELLPERPGVSVSLSWRGVGSGQGTTVRLVGPDSRTLTGLATEVARRLRHIDGVTSVRVEGQDDGQNEVHFAVDRERAHRLGLSPWLVGGTIDFALRGRQLPGLRTSTGDLPIYIQSDLTQTDDRADFERLEMPGLYDGVTLADVATSEVVPGFGSIDRENRRTMLSLTITTGRDDLQALGAEINASVESMRWPRGYGLELGDRFTDLESSRREQNFAILLAVTFVFLLMGVLFESFVLPFSIVLSIPFAFTGVYWLLWLTGTSLDLMAGVGLIILIGIVVNNAIVLVDLASELRRQGMGRDEALVEAGRHRLRPILMTAMTTIFGLVPMAIGDASLVGIPYAPLGVAVIGGLVASTALTLFVVPLVYSLLDDGAGYVRYGLTRAFATVGGDPHADDGPAATDPGDA